ncbi:DUF2218 domain-containing protein [Hoeflea sp. Naph1]|uniref:DUF2218 domain-containing protein n=1 Tax=Hoeflea sp. Naph1 TaxID=3388653 RepID=UPI00398F9366
MHRSAAYLETANGRKYLTQLCKHFAHKIEVSYSEGRGECHFPGSLGRLEADESGLRMAVEADDEDGLKRVQSIIEVHLIQFSFREKLEGLDWLRLERAV